MGAAMSLDAEILVDLHEALAHPVADAIFAFVSLRAGFAVPLLALICLGLCLQWRRDGLITFALTLAVLGIADLNGNILKHLLAQPRPCLEFAHLDWMPDTCPGARRGMPSNHAINFFAVAAFLWTTLRRTRVGLPLALIACAVGISRVYLGRHYPSQVIVGALLGCAQGILPALIFAQTRLGRRMAGLPDKSDPSVNGENAMAPNATPPTT
ncbi:MAG: phosphatase PAP2 family protein [Myxococcaceae bacterium]|nr:phosphatase PAP2 family protein [Myxococcaceae bacterium]